MKKKLGIILLSLVVLQSVYSQDARMAHPFAWDTYYNPATAAQDRVYKVDFGEQLSYTQSSSLFSTTLLSFQAPIDAWKSGVGFKLQHDYEGGGLISLESMSALYSVRVDLTRNTFVQFGVEPDVYCRYVNKNKMLFGDQLDPYYGQISDQSQHLSEIENDVIWSFDMALGFVGCTTLGQNAYHNDVLLKYGFAASHLLEANRQSFFSKNGNGMYAKSLYYRKFVGQLELMCPIVIGRHVDKDWYWSFYGVYERQGSMNDVQVGTYLNDGRVGMVGLGMRVERYKSQTVESMLLHLGGNVFLDRYGDRWLRILYSFQLPFTQGNMITTSVHALSLHYYWDSGRSRSRFKCTKTTSFKILQKSIFTEGIHNRH